MSDLLNNIEQTIKILIVEDSPTQAQLLKFLLEKNGYEVIAAKDGKEALTILSSHKPSLVISDIQMPIMNGFELSRRIKSNPETEEIPVILLTVMNGKDDVIEGLVSEADRFITKPYSKNYLINQVSKILEENKILKLNSPKINLEVIWDGKSQQIDVKPERLVTLMLSTYEAAMNKNLELIQTQEELYSTNEKLEELVQLRTAELSKLNKFFSIIAHDLRGPFSGFLGLTDIMTGNSNELSTSEMLNISKLLNESAKSLYQLLENLLEWSQLQKGSIDYTPKTLNISNLVSRNIEIINQKAVQKRIKLINEVSEQQTIFADEKMIDSVLRNLLSNAIKFTKQGGTVLVFAKAYENNMLQISVKDTGVGIPENSISKLFQLDEKVSAKGTEGEPSSGLGLLLCSEFVEKHGGKIWVESEINEGSTFHFTMPAGN